MKRRSFIVGSCLSLAGAGAYAFLQWMRASRHVEPLAQPKFLSRLCDSRTIRSLGHDYLKLRPNETKGDILDDLLAGKSQKGLSKVEDIVTAELQIENRIKSDFATDNIVVIQGWVLSVTEARQCAFFSKLNT